MSKVFHDKFQMECTFWEDGISFCNVRRNVFYPYGSLDTLSLSLLGVMQAVSHSLVCCFTVDRKDKAEIKDLVKQAREAMKTAPAGEAVVLDLDNLPVDHSGSAEDQLKQYKALFVQGVISKPQYDMMKKLLA